MMSKIEQKIKKDIGKWEKTELTFTVPCSLSIFGHIFLSHFPFERTEVCIKGKCTEEMFIFN